MSIEGGYQPDENERTFSSALFEPIGEDAKDSQVADTASKGEIKARTGNGIVDASIQGAIDGWEQGGEDAKKIWGAVEPVLEKTLDNLTGMGEVKQAVAEHQRKTELRESLERLAQPSQPQASSDK